MGACEHQYTALHACGLASFDDPAPTKRRRKRRKSAPVPDEGAAGPALPLALPRKAAGLEVSAQFEQYEREIARSIKSWEFFETQRAKRLTRL